MRNHRTPLRSWKGNFKAETDCSTASGCTPKEKQPENSRKPDALYALDLMRLSAARRRAIGVPVAGPVPLGR
jgi:hypothetical protein